MWSIIPAAAVLLAQAQPDTAENWCFERGQKGLSSARVQRRRAMPCLKSTPRLRQFRADRSRGGAEQSGATAPPATSEKQTPAVGKSRNR